MGSAVTADREAPEDALRHTAWRFLAWMSAGLCLCLLAVGAFNWLIDPYGVHDRPRVPGFNAFKPAVMTQEPLMKAHQILHLDAEPRTLILGSSKTLMGLDPGSAAWPADMRPIYNLSVAGSDLAEVLNYLNAWVMSRRDRADPRADQGTGRWVVGLDFESFLERPEPGPRQADEQSLRLRALSGAEGPKARAWAMAKDLATATLTLGACADSVDTLLTSLRGKGATLEPNGRSSEWSFEAWTSAGGPASLFNQKLRQSAKQLSDPALTLPDAGAQGSTSWQALDALLALAARERVALHLVVQPSHASHFELLDALGHWEPYERFKAMLTRKVSGAVATGASVVLWDFGGYDGAANEGVPDASASRRPLLGFWDPLHYRSQLGDAMIQRMFTTTSLPEATQDAPSGKRAAIVVPGEALTEQTLEARQARVRAERERYRAQAPDAVARAQQLACSVRSCATKADEGHRP